MLPFDHFRALGVIPQKMVVHTFWVRTAENGAFEGMSSFIVSEFNRYIVFYPKQGEVMEHLQFQNKLVVEEVNIVVKRFVPFDEVLTQRQSSR
jgi:hypothetical protein